MLIPDALDLFEVQLQADGRSIHTIKQYRRHVRLFGAWLVTKGPSNLEGVDVHVVAQFLASSSALKRPDGAPKAWASVNALKASLKGFFAYAAAAGLAARNAGALVRPTRGMRARPRPIRPDELKRLLGAIEADSSAEARRDLVLVRLMAETGMRLGSALGLKREDVDLEAAQVSILTKGGGQQVVDLTPSLAEALGGLVGCDQKPVFRGLHRKPLSPRHFQRRFRGWRERAGVSAKVTPHSLRHAFAMGLYDRTRDLLAVKEALGHQSLSATLIYAQLSPCLPPVC